MGISDSVRRARGAGPPHPVVNAMLICDEIERDPRNGKVTLRGVFETILAQEYPAIHAALAVYVKLTDAGGHYRFRLSLVQLDTGTVVGSGEGELDAPGRMETGELLFRLDKILFPSAGLYEFQLHLNDRYLASKTINVTLLREEESDGAADSNPTG